MPAIWLALALSNLSVALSFLQQTAALRSLDTLHASLIDAWHACTTVLLNAVPISVPTSALMQTTVEPVVEASITLSAYWYVVMAGLSLLVPAGLLLIAVAGLTVERARSAAIGGLAAIGLAAVAYWAVGFALQFGGVGLAFERDDLRALVWEWSALPASWGRDWGMAGLGGWFLANPRASATVYALFLAHLPWAMTAALLPLVALRGRAPVVALLLLSPLLSGILYPLAGNWIHGGGWLSALGRNLNLGHGFVDFGGAGSVHLLAAGVALAALVVWVPRTPRHQVAQQLPPVHLPLLAIVGSLLLTVGSVGWMWSNPLQMAALDEAAIMRGTVSLLLAASAGAVVPLLYTWFVSGGSDPLLGARGVAAGVVGALAVGPFVAPGIALGVGLFAGASVPFVTYLVDVVLRLDDATGAVAVSGVPALLGLIALGVWADGVAGAGWQMKGIESFPGMAQQGVAGLFVADGVRIDFPAQLQAQVIGVLTLALWGFLGGLILCAPLGLLFHALDRSSRREPTPSPAPSPAPSPITAPITVPSAASIDGARAYDVPTVPASRQLTEIARGAEPFEFEDDFTTETQRFRGGA